MCVLWIPVDVDGGSYLSYDIVRDDLLEITSRGFVYQYSSALRGPLELYPRVVPGVDAQPAEWPDPCPSEFILVHVVPASCVV